jgi:hypothetical protein
LVRCTGVDVMADPDMVALDICDMAAALSVVGKERRGTGSPPTPTSPA